MFREGEFFPDSMIFLNLTRIKGVGTRDDIDKTLKLGMNHPMGPLQLGWYFNISPKTFLTNTAADLYVTGRLLFSSLY